MAARILGPGEITPAILKSLIGSAEEGQTLDFKRAINLDKPDAKRDLATDVSAFANESGGDIIYGMDQTADGFAKGLMPLTGVNRDGVEIQLRQICQAQIDPPVPGLQFVTVEFEPDKFAMVMRIPRSWDRPHCVVGNTHTWPIRDGKGNRSMKPRELRDAFMLSAEISERMKAFRAERVAALVARNAPIMPASSELLVLHVLPLSAFDSPTTFDIAGVLKNDLALAHPLAVQTHIDSLTARYNFDGAIAYRSSGQQGEAATYYTQLFRNGCIESVDSRILESRVQGTTTGITARYEVWVEATVRRFLQLLKKNGVEPPIFVMLSLVGVKGRQIGWIVCEPLDSQPPPGSIDRDPLLLPEVRIEAFTTDYYTALKPLFDTLWQCCGRAGSPNYKNDQWNRPDEAVLARNRMGSPYE